MAVLAGVGLVAGACRQAPSDPAPAAAPNLLLIVVDTLRADHLGCYGYARPTSPQIDRLASESVVFDRAYSHSPWTMPSVASLFTSLEPKDHGIANWKQPLDAKLLTLAEHLRARGYRTEAYVSHGVLAPVYGFDQGFGVYDASVVEGRMPRRISTAAEVTDLALAALERPGPFFLWVHYFDPHEDYVRHEGFDFGRRPLDRYDGEIAWTDHHVGRLLEGLRQSGQLDETVVVLTADHGEAFGEHGHLRHSSTLYEELLRVPLILRAPGVRPGRAGFVVRAIDVAPTVLGLLGVAVPEPFRGRALSVEDGRLREPEEAVFVAETRWDGSDVRAIRTGRWKLIVDRSRGSRKLFDLEADPGERNNLRRSHPEVFERLEAALERHYATSAGPAPETPLSEELEERLRSLGYVR